MKAMTLLHKYVQNHTIKLLFNKLDFLLLGVQSSLHNPFPYCILTTTLHVRLGQDLVTGPRTANELYGQVGS